MIVLDANVLIGFLDATDIHHRASLDLLERHYAEGLATSALTLAEVLVHPTRAGRQEAAIAAIEAIGVELISINATDAAGIARVRGTYRLRMPDAVALYATISTGAGLATFDDSLAAAAGQAGVRVVITNSRR